MRKTVLDIIKMKNKQKISVLTSYDYTIARLCDKAGIDILLVGDSAGMVMLGYDSTIPVTMEQMILFTSAVRRGTENSLVVADLPFMSYQSSTNDAITNAGKLIKAGADAVKLEGGAEMRDKIEAITNTGIPVMGHIGFQPQTSILFEGYKVQGRSIESAKKLLHDSKTIQDAGAFCIVLEMVTKEVAKLITESLEIPTIGIGSGPYCDGQVIVVHDALGMYDKINPKFVKKYLDLSDEITRAVKQYKNDVVSKKFPKKENTFSMSNEEYKKLRKEIEEQK